MKLYHYAPHLFDQLQTKRKRGAADAEEIRRAEKDAVRILQPGATYVDHLSFFFEPVPSDILHLLYGEGHPVWFKGSKLYEYVIDPLKFPEKILYEVVESQKETEALEKFTQDHNWVEDDPVFLKKWFAFILSEKIKWGEYGNDKYKLLLQIKKHQGRLEKDFLAATQREDFKQNFNKYAASVPHLMVYPPTGTVDIESRNQIVIGKKERILQI